MNTNIEADTERHPADTTPNGQVTASSGKETRKKRVWLVLGGLIALAVIAGGVRYWMWASGHEETDDAYVAGHLHEVSSRVAGTVISVEVDDNQAIGAGAVLVRLDPHDFQVRLDQAEATLAAAKRQAETASTSISFTAQNARASTAEAQGGVEQATAGIATAKAVVAEAESGVSNARAKLVEMQATLERAKRDDERYYNLVRKEQVSRQQYDNAHAAYKIALAGETAAQTAVQEAEARLVHARHSVQQAEAVLVRANGTLASAKTGFTDIEVRRGQHKTAQSNVALAQAAVDEARLQLSYTVIAAPVAGTVGKKTVEAGQRVQPGQPLMAVVEPQIWVVANYKETQLTHMRKGQPVDVQVDTFPGSTFRGTVGSFSPASGASFALLPPDNATGNFTKIVQRVPVKVLLWPESVRGFERRLVPGLSAVVTVAVQ